MNDDRHIIAIRMNEAMMHVFFREGATFRCVAGVPADAVFLGCVGEFSRRSIVAHFEHPSFPVYLLGAEPIMHDVCYEVIEHPQAGMVDMIPVKIGMDRTEMLSMREWVLDRAAEIEGRTR